MQQDKPHQMIATLPLGKKTTVTFFDDGSARLSFFEKYRKDVFLSKEEVESLFSLEDWYHKRFMEGK